jgi:hypothetical protein
MKRRHVVLSISIFKVAKFWTKFDESLYECYTIEGHPELPKLGFMFFHITFQEVK